MQTATTVTASAFAAICGAATCLAAQRIALEEMAAREGLSVTAEDQSSVTLRRGGTVLLLTHGSRCVRFAGLAVWLNDAVLRGPASWSLARYDADTVVAPMLRGGALAAIPERPTVVLDPGHGGRQTGALAGNLAESAAVLDIARRAQRYLRAAGMDARLTRARDEGLGLAQRTALAAKWRGDILISIHANSAANRAAAGIETYVMAGPGFASTSGNTSDPRLFAGNRNDARNSVLALCVQRNLLAATGAEDRGIRRARFDVLREAPCPAVLVECGFLSNPGESVRLASAAYREQLARAISEGIWDYCRLGRREIVPAAVRPRPESPSL